MEALIRNITANGNWILKLNLFFAIIFFLVTLAFVSAIFYLRIVKTVRTHQTEKLKEILSNFITLYLFDEIELSEEEIENFNNRNIQTLQDRRVAIKVLLIFEENFKGVSNDKIKELFLKWNLSGVVEDDLKSGKWYKVARAIYVASELNLKRFHLTIEQFIDAERDELRQQAILYFIQLSKDDPLSFFARIQKPLTLWEQIYIEESLKANYSGEEPDFSKWLDHELISIKVFAIKMIGIFNQYENVSRLEAFLQDTEEDIRKETIKSLCNLGYPELLESLYRSFKDETPVIKSLILKTVRKIGSLEDLLRFERLIPEDDFVNRQVYFKLWSNWKKQLKTSAV